MEVKSINNYNLCDETARKEGITNSDRLNTIEKFLSNNICYPQMKDGKIYGVKFTTTGSTIGTRTEAAVRMVAGVSTDTTSELNDFDNVPVFKFNLVNGYLSATNEFIETAVQGYSPSFALDGSNGDVYVRYPLKFFKYIFSDEYEEIQISDTQHEGFAPYGVFIKSDGTLKDYCYIARYRASTGTDGKYASISGKTPLYNVSHNSQLTGFRSKGSQYCGMTTREYAMLSDMFQVEFANRNSQAVMAGCTMWGNPNTNGQKPVSIAESDAERVILSNADATVFYPGCSVSISANGITGMPDRNSSSTHTTVNRKRVTSIEVYDDTNKALNIDNGGTTFTTTTSMTVSAMPSITGMTDNILGTSGSFGNNTDGYHDMSYRGVENLYGSQWIVMSDVIISAYKPYICYDNTKFSTSVTSDYVGLNYNLSTSNGYCKSMGYDENNPSVRGCTSTSGSSTTYYSDYYYINGNTSNEWLLGGSLYNGSNAGLFYGSGYSAVGYAYWNFGARLSVNGPSKAWRGV